MTKQAKEISAVLAAAGLRRPGYGATMMTSKVETTRVDWNGPEPAAHLLEVASALREAGFYVRYETGWACCVVTRDPPLNLDPAEEAQLPFWDSE